MISIFSRKTRRALYIIVAILMYSACTSRPASAPAGIETGEEVSIPNVALPPASGFGKEDGGGGFALFSTQDEVRAAIVKSWRYALHPNAETNPLSQLTSWYMNHGKNDKIQLVLGKMFFTDSSVGQYKNFWEYLKKSGDLKVVDKKCESRNQLHTDASVSHHRVGAVICISTTSLQRIPSYSLVNEILGLLVHEIAHINGYDEAMAQEIQKVAAAFFAQIASGTAADERRAVVRKHIALSDEELRLIFLTEAFDPRNPTVLNSLNTTTLLLDQIPKFKDLVHLELTLNVENVATCRRILDEAEKVKKDLKALILNRKDVHVDRELSDHFEDEDSSYEFYIMNPDNWDKSLKVIVESTDTLRKIQNDLNTCFTNKEY